MTLLNETRVRVEMMKGRLVDSGPRDDDHGDGGTRDEYDDDAHGDGRLYWLIYRRKSNRL